MKTNPLEFVMNSIYTFSQSYVKVAEPDKPFVKGFDLGEMYNNERILYSLVYHSRAKLRKILIAITKEDPANVNIERYESYAEKIGKLQDEIQKKDIETLREEICLFNEFLFRNIRDRIPAKFKSAQIKLLPEYKIEAGVAEENWDKNFLSFFTEPEMSVSYLMV